MNRRKLRHFIRACFTGPRNTLITLACLAVLYFAVPPFWSWAVTNATWDGNAQACRAAGGACWTFVREKFWFSIFGLYPDEERWRLVIRSRSCWRLANAVN